MANQIWVGNAAAISQVTSITIGGTPAAGNTYSATMGFGAGKTVTYTATVSDTNTTIATALTTLLAASLFPEFREVSWTNPSAGVIQGTALTVGYPFTVTTSTTGTGSPTATVASVTASSGPNDAKVAANWSTGSLPVTSDSIFFQASNVPCLHNLDAIQGITPALVQVDASFTAAIGLPVNNSNGYREYRQRYLQFTGATSVVIGQGQGNGSGKLQFDFQGGNFAASVWKSAPTIEPGQPAVLFKGGTGSSSVQVLKGTVGLALLAGETANVSAGLEISYSSNQASDAQVQTGPGCTLSTVTMSGGQLTSRCAVPTLNSTGGNATVLAGGMTTANLNETGSGTPPSVLKYTPPTAQTITNYSVGNNAVLDCSGTLAAITLTGNGSGPTTGTVYKGGTINAPAGNLTFTHPFTIPDGQLSDVTLNLGSNRTVSVV